MYLNQNNFKVLDYVVFEVANLSTRNYPRWVKNADHGASGIWAIGVVRSVDDYVIRVEYEIDGYTGSGFSNWPNIKNNDYKSTQWSRSGFLKKVACECGGLKAKTTHSSWCLLSIHSIKFKFIK
jgi:hypothetical protein